MVRAAILLRPLLKRMSSSSSDPPVVEPTPIYTFTTTTALAGLFLWIIFGYLSVLLNCDLHRILTQNPWAIHLSAVVAFYFLFTVLSSNVAPIWLIWLKTIGVYVIFLLMTKSKWYFVLPVMTLILADQCFRQQVNYEKLQGRPIDEKTSEFVSNTLLILIIVIVIIGTSHYMHLQMKEYGSEFSIVKFFFGINTACKVTVPDYEKIALNARRLPQATKSLA